MFAEYLLCVGIVEGYKDDTDVVFVVKIFEDIVFNRKSLIGRLLFWVFFGIY